jgi:YfiH family protein
VRLVTAGNGLIYLESNPATGIRFIMSTRSGGSSKGPFASLNLGFSTGDDREAVERNRRLFFEASGLSSPAFTRQEHGRSILIAAAAGLAGHGDGLVTAVPRLPVSCLVADCAPVAAADPVAGVAGIAHAGWRGAAAGIARALVESLRALGAEPARLAAAVLPCIGPCCCEVGDDVAARFRPAHVLIRPGRRARLDLPALLRDELTGSGVPAGNVETWALCTRCRSDLFFSYRRDGTAGGRMLAAAVISP